MNIILLGPPGAGKGTQAEILRKALNIPHISTGDMLRAAIAKGDDFGKSVEATVAAGHLVPDDTMIKLVQRRIAEPDCIKGFILDGFPRTPEQAVALEHAGIKLDFAIQIEVPDAKIVQRLGGRRIHQASGRTYNIYSHPPKVEGVDDVTGEPLMQRPDDNEATVLERLSVYHKKTEPLIAFYKQEKKHGVQFITVDGMQDEEQVCQQILQRMQVAQNSL
jgi:adenylate kinase